MYYILNRATSCTHFFITENTVPDEKCLPYGPIKFQYLITDTQSLPTPEQQPAIAKLSLSLSRSKPQSTM